jgi:rhodanese-related sulfurtransferase
MTQQLVLRILAGGALVMGAFAAVAGSPRSGANASVDIDALAHDVQTEADHVTAVELARWIRDRKPRLRIIDVRDSAEFEQFHIPLAEHIPLETVVKTPFKNGETVVLYSGGGAHAAQAWVFLRARGVKDVFFLRGGLAEWLDDVLNPRIPIHASAEERAAFDSVAELSRYFDGVPRRVDSVVPLQSIKASVARVRGRGC